VSARSHESDRLAVFVGSFGFCGFFPWAPATFASAVATPILAWMYPLSEGLAYAGLITFLLLVGVWSAMHMERIYGQDPSALVLDEVLGMAIALAAMPITLATCVLAFLFFRVFDILKLWPGRALERLPHGWGVMADDACAGVYAALGLRGILYLWKEPHLEWWHAGALAVVAVPLFAFRKPLLRKYGKKRSRLGDARGPASGAAS
jgi:phosphatidylglycerophosphatase A